MGIENFVKNWMDTSEKIHQAWMELMKKENLCFAQFLLKTIKDTSLGIYYVFLKWEIDGLINKKEVESIKNDTSEQVAYLLGWYYLDPAILIGLKKYLENQWINAKSKYLPAELVVLSEEPLEGARYGAFCAL